MTIVFLVASTLSIAALGLSAAQLGISVGDTTTQTTATGARLTIPVQLNNGGFLPVNSLTLQAVVLLQNVTLTQSISGPYDVQPKESKTVPLSIAFDLTTISPDTLKRLAFNDTSLTLQISDSMSLYPLAAVHITAQTLYPWGALIKNLRVGIPSFSLINLTARAIADYG